MRALTGSLYDDRRRLLADAKRACNRGRSRRAIAIYRQILLEDPRNVPVKLRLSPLLAGSGESFEAWQHFRAAARDLARGRRYEECLSVYREACRCLPREFEAWRLRAELELRLGREEEAYETLLEGRRFFDTAGTRAQAISLLTRARAIEPWDPELCLDLAQLYARCDLRVAAYELLAILAYRVEGWELCRVRARQWRLTLSFHDAWRWLRAVSAELRGGDADGASGFPVEGIADAKLPPPRADG